MSKNTDQDPKVITSAEEQDLVEAAQIKGSRRRGAPQGSRVK